MMIINMYFLNLKTIQTFRPKALPQSRHTFVNAIYNISKENVLAQEHMISRKLKETELMKHMDSANPFNTSPKVAYFRKCHLQHIQRKRISPGWAISESWVCPQVSVGRPEGPIRQSGQRTHRPFGPPNGIGCYNPGFANRSSWAKCVFFGYVVKAIEIFKICLNFDEWQIRLLQL